AAQARRIVARNGTPRARQLRRVRPISDLIHPRFAERRSVTANPLWTSCSTPPPSRGPDYPGRADALHASPRLTPALARKLRPRLPNNPPWEVVSRHGPAAQLRPDI